MSSLCWLGLLVKIGEAGGFVLGGELNAKRIGGIGPWLLVAVGVIDALLVVMFRVHAMIGFDHATRSFADMAVDRRRSRQS